jgi:hypothetical protein
MLRPLEKEEKWNYSEKVNCKLSATMVGLSKKNPISAAGNSLCIIPMS